MKILKKSLLGLCLSRIILFAIISQSHGEILRLKCATYANFSVEENNRKLESTFLTLHGLDTPQCQSECSLNKRCKTININEDELICELNDKSSEDVKDNVTTVAGVGWTYYSTRYNETLVCRWLFQNHHRIYLLWIGC